MNGCDYNLMVVAHPDDETLFFSSLFFRMRTLPWHVVCVTDANADGMGPQRRGQFEMALELLGGGSCQNLGFADIYEKRLEQAELQASLAGLSEPKAVFTHGPIGEYMHPHHQDVSYAVHKVWSDRLDVYSVAYNCMPDKVYVLAEDEYKLKCRILSTIYGEETCRFLNLLPSTFVEGFSRIPLSEVEAIYRRLSGDLAAFEGVKLHYYDWLRNFMAEKASKPLSRPF